ncbi:MAG: cytochrome c [Maricaulaceae bacterium]|jgi:mono/diheme cytochrome c family protein
MRKTLITLACAGALGACGQTATSTPDYRLDMESAAAMRDAGRILAEAECARCHSAGLSGESRNPDAPPLRELNARYPGALLMDAFPERMRVGHPAMPEFDLTVDQVDSLLEYILSIQTRQGV